MQLRRLKLAVIFSPWILLIACQRESKTLFTSIPSGYSGIDFANPLDENHEINIIEYLYFYNGAGVAAGDINNDGLPDIYLASNQHGNKLYLNKGAFTFEDITAIAHISSQGTWNTGVSMADVNGDGWLDIYVCEVGNYKTLQGQNRLYINNHDLTFSERAAEFNLAIKAFSTQAAWLDFDRDGDLDMYLLCHSVHSPDTYRDTSIRRLVDPLKGDKLFRNDHGQFIDISLSAGIFSSPLGYGLGIGISDLNQDGWPDILVGNDFHENDYLYINQKNGTFSQTQTHSFPHTSTFSMGNDIADINNDGKMDILSLDMKPEDETILKNSVGADPYDIFEYKLSFGFHYQYPRNTFQLNQYTDQQGTPYFSEVGQQCKISRTDWSWTPLLADFDNNGWIDIFIANGIAHRPNDLDYLKYFSSQAATESAPARTLIDKMPSGLAKNYFYSQDESFKFTDQSQTWNPEGLDISTAAAYADFDRDGDLDLIVNRINQQASLLRNESNTTSHYIQFHLEDTGQNKFGVGAKVIVYQSSGIQVRELYPSRGFQSSSDYTVHFGLGNTQTIDSVLIVWPNGHEQNMISLPIDSSYTIRPNPADSISSPSPPPTALIHKIDVGITFIHQENEYNDFEREKLLLYKLSTQGPGCAIGDINGDGLDDLWIGGARGQSGLTYLQNRAGGFVALTQNSLDMHASFEDIDGCWLDVDQDKDLDLIVASGGYQVDDPLLLNDRLYVNDGKGNLSFQDRNMPAIPHMSSCIAPHDFDQDGDIDLFIGGRVSPFYGYNTDSYLLINDGKGSFSLFNDPVTKGLGMITDAVWADVDPVPGVELIVCGEWMPITIVYRQGPLWKKKSLPASSGIWQAIETADMDGDGDMDLVAGNLGTNHDLIATEAQPIKLYVADFDQNSSPETLISYFKSGKEYSFFSKDELASQLVYLKKKYTDYQSFSNQSFNQIFPTANQDKSAKKVTTLASQCFQNMGGGNFNPIALPFEAQNSVVFALCLDDINGDHQPDIVLGGNLYETHPSFGRLDASYAGVLINQEGMRFHSLPPAQSGLFIEGAVRDIKKINSNGQSRLLFVRNGATPVIFGGN